MFTYFGCEMDINKLKTMYLEQELPLKEIAAFFSVDRSAILYHVKKHGWPQRNKSRVRRKAGEIIGDWTLLEYNIKGSKGYFSCQCKCGLVKDINVAALNQGGSKSCHECAMEKLRDMRTVPSNYWLKIILSASRREIPVSITHEEIESLLIQQTHQCALTGWEIGFGRGKKKDGSMDGETTASLDRIDSSLSYETGNIQWVHKDIQNMKQSFKEERLLVLCEAILDYAKEGKNVRSSEVSTKQKPRRSQSRVRNQNC
jgi:hypothetical protein